MSRITSVNKSYSYDCAPLKTPNFKEITPAPGSYERTKDATPHPPILMDEYGQTPDHFYLARKPPPSFFQVKRRLDLQSVATPKVNNSKTKQRKKTNIMEKHKGKSCMEKPRYDTSLGQLTKKFLKLLSDATDGVINLNTACALLSVPKRRLYDITNVLEGAGLIQKTSRNNIQWMGRVSSPCASVVKYDLEREIDILESKENQLDELIYYMKSEIDTMKETDAKYHYVTSEDLQSIEEFSQKKLIAVNKSPLVQVVESSEKTVLITSKSFEVEAYLLHDDTSISNVLHPKAIFRENSYSFKIESKPFSDKSKNSSLPAKSTSSQVTKSENCDDFEDYNQVCGGRLWSEGDTVIKNAFITEEDDIAPMGKHFLLQTEDQDLDLLPFSLLESTEENYSFSLDDGEGLTDLFDCNFSCP